MNKRILILTGVLGTSIALTGCTGGTPEDKAIKAFDDTAKIVFEIKDEKELDKVVSDMKAKYDLLDLEDEIENNDYSQLYSELFVGSSFVKDYVSTLQDSEISFKKQDVRYVKLDKGDFEIISNPKLYVGDGEFLKLDDMFLIYNKEPIVVQNYDKIEKESSEEIEFIMPMIVDAKGNIKAIAFIEESERDFADELFLSEKGIGSVLKDVEELGNSLNDLNNLLDDLTNETPTVEEDKAPVTNNNVEEDVQTSKPTTDTGSYVTKSGLSFDIEDGEYATYEDSKSGLDIFVSFFSNGEEAIDVTIPSANISNVEFKKQIELAMTKVCGNTKNIDVLNAKIAEVLTEKYQSKEDVKAEIDRWSGMFSATVVETDDYEIEIVVYDAGSHNESISVEFMMY